MSKIETVPTQDSQQQPPISDQQSAYGRMHEDSYGQPAHSHLAPIRCETSDKVPTGIAQVADAKQPIFNGLHEGDENKVIAAIQSVQPCSRQRLEQSWTQEFGVSLTDTLRNMGFTRALLALENDETTRGAKWLTTSLDQIGTTADVTEKSSREHTLRATFATMSKADMDKLRNEDLGKIQSVLIPAFEKDSFLKDKVLQYKTVDPLIGVGKPSKANKPGMLQDAKVFTIYVRDQKDAIAVEKQIDELLADKVGKPRTPIVTGNAETSMGLSGRVSLSRDYYPAGLAPDGRLGAELAPNLENDIYRKVGKTPGTHLSEAELRSIESESQIAPETLCYDKTGKLMLRARSPYSEVPKGKKLFYASEEGANLTPGQLTDRPALYALTRWAGGPDADPVFVWDN